MFGCASLACGLAPGVGLLVASRAVQGVGGAAMAVTAFALIGSVYRGPDLGRAMGVFGAVTGLAAALGPMVGGVLTQYVGWRAVFLLNLPLVALTVLLALRVLPAGRRGAGAARVDLPGTAAFALAAGTLTYALSLAGERRWTSPTVLGLLALSGLALAAFGRIELRSAAPLLDLRLFARPFFSAAMVCVLAATAAFAALVYTSVWLQ
ncbi:MFS transporter, partial [Kitasatospora sp. NPDC056531]|uniref:MFS transporter n=1 Tax=Kitasatospora sp. NPDC056531 TaxID=3345856 RepID=UPI00369DA75C